MVSSVFRGGGACGHGSPPPRKVRKHFLTRYTVKNGISNLHILLKSVLKMQEMPYQRPMQLCRHYGLPLTKILATPLFMVYNYAVLFECLKTIRIRCSHFVSNPWECLSEPASDGNEMRLADNANVPKSQFSRGNYFVDAFCCITH